MFSSITQMQITGLIILLISTPFLIKSVRNFYFANASKNWPKVSGTIIEMPIVGRKYKLLYKYTVNRTTINCRRICFTNTSRPQNQDIRAFEDKYALHRIVDVFYNPINPKQAVLEPGRNDGLLLDITLLGALFVFGCAVIFQQISIFGLIASPFKMY